MKNVLINDSTHTYLYNLNSWFANLESYIFHIHMYVCIRGWRTFVLDIVTIICVYFKVKYVTMFIYVCTYVYFNIILYTCT